MESFKTLLEAQILLEDWRHEYNHHRPHQSLTKPHSLTYQWHAQHQPQTLKKPQTLITRPS